MRFLAEARRVISVEELLRVRRGEQELSPGSVVVTFDDGYADFATYAWPVLRELGLPVVLFVPTGQVSRRPPWFWWDRLWAAVVQTERAGTPVRPAGALPLGTPELARDAYRCLRDHLKDQPHDVLLAEVEQIVAALGEPSGLPAILDWPSLRRLRDEGVTIASHTVTHPLLPRLDAEARRRELTASMDALVEELGATPPIVAYPAGACDEDVVDDTTAAGYEIGFTTHRGVNDVRTADWHRLARINVGGRTSTAALRAQLHPRLADLARAVA